MNVRSNPDAASGDRHRSSYLMILILRELAAEALPWCVVLSLFVGTAWVLMAVFQEISPWIVGAVIAVEFLFFCLHQGVHEECP